MQRRGLCNLLFWNNIVISMFITIAITFTGLGTSSCKALSSASAPSAKAAKHRRAKDKKLREILCWWIANDKVYPHGDRCNFRHTVSENGALLPNPAPKTNNM